MCTDCGEAIPATYVHQIIDDAVVAEVLLGREFPPEEDRRLTVPLEAHGCGQTVRAAPEGVLSRRGSVARVVVGDAVPHASGGPDNDVRAVHRVEIVLRPRCVLQQSHCSIN